MRVHHRITFAVLAVIAVVLLGLTAVQTSGSPYYSAVWLRSGYSPDGSVGGLEAHALQFSLQRTAQGWTGWMTLDPNAQKFSEFGYSTETTLMTGERIKITLSPFGNDETAGRTCYLVNQNRLERTMYLVFPNHGGGTYRLIIRGPGHVATHVVFLEEERADEMIAVR